MTGIESDANSVKETAAMSAARLAAARIMAPPPIRFEALALDCLGSAPQSIVGADSDGGNIKLCAVRPPSGQSSLSALWSSDCMDRTLLAGHDVRQHRSGVKGFRHPLLGDLIIAYEWLDLPADPGQSLVTYLPRDSDRAAISRLATLGGVRRKAAAEANKTTVRLRNNP
jgi:hypothetical protein